MKIIAGAVLLFLTSGLVYSAWTIQGLRTQVSDLETKVSTLAERPAAPAPAAPEASSKTTGMTASTSSTGAAAQPDGTEGTIFAGTGEAPAGRKPSTDAPSSGLTSSPLNSASWTEAERAAFEKEVVAVLEKRQEENQERQEKRQQEWMTSRLKDQLKLTDQQAEQVGAVIASSMNTIRDLRNTITDENRDAVRAEIQKTTQQADATIKSYLTAEQVVAYDEVKKQTGGFGMGGGGNRRRGNDGQDGR